MDATTDPSRIAETRGHQEFVHTVTTGGLDVESIEAECLAYAYDELRGDRFKAVRAAHGRGWAIKHPAAPVGKCWF